jgi:hypothetical protein
VPTRVSRSVSGTHCGRRYSSSFARPAPPQSGRDLGLHQGPGASTRIPLGLFLLLALALVYTIGYVVGALALGRLVVKEPTSRYVAFLAGWVILRILALVPFLGGFAWLVATVLGLGTLWVTARAAPREVGAVAPALAPPPPVTR